MPTGARARVSLKSGDRDIAVLGREWSGTEGGGRLFFTQGGDGAAGEGFLDEGERVVEFAVQGTHTDGVGLQLEGAGADASNGVDSVDDVENGHDGGGRSQAEAAAAT